MCRILAKMSLREESIKYEMIKAPHSLLYMSQNGRQPEEGRGPHGDGWGLAFRRNREMVIEKEGTPAYEDKKFQELASGITTDLLVASVRLATPGIPITKENAHPFRVGDLILVHNGTIKEGLERSSESDTLDFLRWISKNWNREDKNLIELLRKASNSWIYTSLSFLMTDGEKLYVFRQTLKEPKKLNYYTLYALKSERSFLVSSEPLDDRNWELLRNGSLLIIRFPREWKEMSLE